MSTNQVNGSIIGREVRNHNNNDINTITNNDN